MTTIYEARTPDGRILYTGRASGTFASVNTDRGTIWIDKDPGARSQFEGTWETHDESLAKYRGTIYMDGVAVAKVFALTDGTGFVIHKLVDRKIGPRLPVKISIVNGITRDYLAAFGADDHKLCEMPIESGERFGNQLRFISGGVCELLLDRAEVLAAI